MGDKQTALVIAPGRGTYAKGELGYLGEGWEEALARL